MTRSQRLLAVLALNLALFAGLVAAGAAAGSLAVLATGGDYLLDAAAVGVALLAARLAARPRKRPALYGPGADIQAAIWARELKPSLFRMLRTWLSTVRSEMNRRLPISLLVRPSATSRATSASRLASGPGPAGAGAGTAAGAAAAAGSRAGSPRARSAAASRLSCRPASYSAANRGQRRAAVSPHWPSAS
jgi:hypothetical protein